LVASDSVAPGESDSFYRRCFALMPAAFRGRVVFVARYLSLCTFATTGPGHVSRCRNVAHWSGVSSRQYGDIDLPSRLNVVPHVQTREAWSSSEWRRPMPAQIP